MDAFVCAMVLRLCVSLVCNEVSALKFKNSFVGVYESALQIESFQASFKTGVFGQILEILDLRRENKGKYLSSGTFDGNSCEKVAEFHDLGFLSEYVCKSGVK